MKDITFVFFLLLLSSCAQTGYQSSYIMSDSAKDSQESLAEKDHEVPR